MVFRTFKRKWYRHTAYVYHPEVNPIPHVVLPNVCCVHNNAVTDAGTLFQMNWQSVNPPAVKILNFELIHQQAPGRGITDLVSRATMDVEAAKVAGEELSLDDAVRKQIADWHPEGASKAQPGERWDVYRVELGSVWPETIFDPDSDPGLKCVIM